MSENAVHKYIHQPGNRGLITTEPTEMVTKYSGRRIGNLLFPLQPIQGVIDEHSACLLTELELATERQRVVTSRAGAGKPRATPVGRRVPSFGAGQGPCITESLQGGFGPLSSRCGGVPIRGICHPERFTGDEIRNWIKAGVAAGASGRSQLPAVRAVTGLFRWPKVGSKSSLRYHFCSHYSPIPTVTRKNVPFQDK